MDVTSTIQSGNADSLKDHNHIAVLDDLDKMTKELLTLEEQFLRLGVRTHLLEVELATQFSPDLLEDQERADKTCQECELVVDKERQRVESLCAIDMETESCSIETRSLLESESFALNKDDINIKSLELQQDALEEKVDCEEHLSPSSSYSERKKDVED